MHFLCRLCPTRAEGHLSKLWRQYGAKAHSPAGNVVEESPVNQASREIERMPGHGRMTGGRAGLPRIDRSGADFRNLD
jgi:hypothetical protein